MRLTVSRRFFLGAVSMAAWMKQISPAWGEAGGAVAVVGLRTDYLDHPLGIDTERPSLSWRLESSSRGVMQTAFRVRVASTPEKLEQDGADIWDSGKIASSRCFGVAYEGPALKSRQICYWRVDVWTNRCHAPARSVMASWEMGLLHPSDWAVQWLAVETPGARGDREAGLHWIGGRGSAVPRKFRHAFELPAPAHGKLVAVATGGLDLWLDGEQLQLPPVNEHALGGAPAVSVPVRLDRGMHIIAASVAAPEDSRSELAALLSVALEDGRTLRITSEGWMTGFSDRKNWQTTSENPAEWKPADAGNMTSQPWPPEPGFLLRYPFRTSGRVRRARVYATALGAYELQINGGRVGDALLAPESTDFRKRALYQTYDVTGLLKEDDNVLGALVSDGWYASNVAPGGRYAFGPAPRRLLAQLEIEYADGRRDTIGTGAGWKMKPAAVLRSEIYDGEDYDARLEQPGWCNSGFDARDWREAELARPPPCRLVAQCSPPIRRQLVMTAKSIAEPRPGVYVFDFGQNFSGWARLKVKGAAGTTVGLRFAEILLADGNVDQSNLRAARAADYYTLRGDPDGESYEPFFTYHGFRYVEVTGFPGQPTRTDVQGIVVHSDLDQTGRLHIGDPLIQQLWLNTLWSQRSNFMGIPTDCPQRDERLGWMGDANVFWDAAAFNMAVLPFTRRFLGDVRDAQADYGAFADYAPAAEKIVWNGPGAAPGWADAGVVLPWIAWRRYGDTGIIDQHWEAMQAYIRYVHSRNLDFVWRNERANDYGDWLALDAVKPGDPTTPKDLIGTATWAHSVSCLVEMAEATGRQSEATRYRAMRAGLERAFQAEFVRSDGAVGNGSQTGYILSLRYGLVPEALRAAAAAKLVADIGARGTLLSTGFLGTPNSLDVLCDAGYPKLAYDLLLRTDFPSWGYMIARGATTIWERWNGDTGDVSMNSFNHYALGAICGFVFRRIAGIDLIEPGFRRIRFRPVLDERVRSGGADYDSVIGRISTRWTQDKGRFALDMSVPCNATANVHLPAAAGARIAEGGREVASHPDVRILSRTSDEAVLLIGSGEYRFEVT